jgi:hypothetical protein
MDKEHDIRCPSENVPVIHPAVPSNFRKDSKQLTQCTDARMEIAAPAS